MIEYDLRAFMYGLSKRRGKKPEPLDLPSDIARRKHAEDSAERAKDEVDEILADILNSESEVRADG